MGLVENFLELHKIDKETTQLQEHKVRLPETLEKSKKKLAETEQQWEKYLKKSKKDKLHITEQEKLLLEIDAIVARKAMQLNQVKNNKEYEILQQEIADKKQEKDQLEIDILELIETSETEEQDSKNCKKNIEIFKIELEQKTQEVKQTLTEINDRLQSLEKLRLEKKVILDKEAPDLMETYERIYNTHTGDVLASVEEGSCGFCQIQLQPNDLSVLKGGKMIFCRICERLLYMPSHER